MENYNHIPDRSIDTDMNFKKSKILLEKINVLFKSMEMDKENINPIENDLMLKYLRDLYESFYWEHVLNGGQQAVQQPVAPPKRVITKTPKPKPPVEKPVPVEVIEEVQIEINEVTAPPPPEPPKAPPVFRYEPPKPEPPKQQQFKTDPQSEALFEEEASSEISQKLSTRPISDLRQAFGINDKMLLANELFEGNNTAFNDAIEKLNTFSSMNQAKMFLIENMTLKYNWIDPSKEGHAKNFIKTIRRRYA